MADASAVIRAIRSAIELIVLGQPGGTDLLRAYQVSNPDLLRSTVRRLFPAVVSDNPQIFPRVGVVTGDFVVVSDGGNLDRISRQILEISEIRNEYKGDLVILPADPDRGSVIPLAGDNSRYAGRSVRFDIEVNEPLLVVKATDISPQDPEVAPLLAISLIVTRLSLGVKIATRSHIPLAILGSY